LQLLVPLLILGLALVVWTYTKKSRGYDLSGSTLLRG
jgi:hypothetical protein